MRAEFHVIERAIYKTCRRAWWYAYRERLVPIIRPKDARWVGTGGHRALAAYYRGEDPIAELHKWYDEEVPRSLWEMMTPEERADTESKFRLLLGVISRYVTEYAPRVDDFDEIVSVETPVRARVPGTYSWLVGTFDLLVRREGRLWVVDHKFVSSFVEEEDLYMDDQMTAYLWLVQQVYGEKPRGALYDQILKKVPEKPKVLKNGTLSRDRLQNTSVELYRQAIHELGLDESEYQDMLEYLSQKKFYSRVEVARSPRELEVYGDQLRRELTEMRRKNLPIYPNPTRDCRWGCDYQPLCRVENEGGDVNAVKELMYRREE